MNQYPTIGKRAGEAAIDYAIVWAALLTYGLTFGQPEEGGEYKVEGIAALLPLLFWFLYFPLVEGLTGQTFGKRLMGIRVVKLNGGKVGIWDSFVRRLFDMVDLMFFGLVAILVMRNSKEKQRIGDLVAKTMVIKDLVALCSNCGQRVTLDWQDMTAGHYTCPSCSHENDYPTKAINR